MRIAALLATAVTVFLVFSCFRVRKKRKSWKNARAVLLPFYLAVIGAVVAVGFSVPTLLCAWDGQWTFAAFAVFVLGSDTMMVAYLNCVILYDDRGFLARNFLGIKRECGHGQVEGVRTGSDCRVYFQGHSILIDEISIGGDEFLEALEAGYKNATGKRLPYSPSLKRKWDPMNGHLDYPWFYFILWITLALFCVAMPAFAIYSITSETDPNDIILQQARFSAYDIEDGTLELYVDGEEKPYKISFYRYYLDILPEPEALCDGELYTVGIIDDHRNVYSLTGGDGTRYITPEIKQEIYRDSQKTAVWILALFAPVGVVFCCMGIFVGRNPQRYSEKVQRMFYKEGYLH